MDKKYSLSITSQTLVFLFFLATLYSCTVTPEGKLTKHYSEEMLQGFKKISDQHKSREAGINLLDSLYKTFPSISETDKYRYYDFKRELVERIRDSDRSYDTAISYVDSMIAVIEEKDLEKTLNKEYIKAFSMRAEYFTRLQRYNDAIRDVARCKQLNSEAGDSCLMAENTKTLSYIAYKQDNYPHAITLLKEAIVLVESCKKDKEQFVRMQRYLDDLGFFYLNVKKYDSSVVHHLAAANYVLQNQQLMGQDTVFISSALESIYGNLGYVFFLQNNYVEAEKYIRKAMLLTKDAGLAKMQSLLGIIYLQSGKINEAEEMAEKAAHEIYNLEPPYKRELFELQSNIAKAKKQYEKAFKYQEKLLLIKDTIYKGRLDLLTKNPFVEYEQLDKKYQVELLKKDNRNQRNKTTAAIAIGILLTLIAAIFLYFLWRLRTLMNKRSVLYRKLTKTMEEKDLAEKQLREKELFSQEMRLQMEFNEAIIQQRRQISDDMHDELSSSLAALKFYVEDIKSRSAGTAAEKPLSDIRDEVSTVYQNARSYMHGLKTNNWETRFSLIGFLKEIHQKFSEKGLMNIKLNLDEESIKSMLSTRQHDQLYHIIREAISNVIKHAGATELLISIYFNENTCNCVIADNGIGFNKEQIQYGIGIQSIKTG